MDVVRGVLEYRRNRWEVTKSDPIPRSGVKTWTMEMATEELERAEQRADIRS